MDAMRAGGQCYVSAGVDKEAGTRAGWNRRDREQGQTLKLARAQVFLAKLDVVNADGRAFSNFFEQSPLLLGRAAGKLFAVGNIAEHHSSIAIYPPGCGHQTHADSPRRGDGSL